MTASRKTMWAIGKKILTGSENRDRLLHMDEDLGHYSEEESERDHRMIILGNRMQDQMDEFTNSTLSKLLRGWLNRHVTDADERKLFNLKPLKKQPRTLAELEREIALLEIELKKAEGSTH